MEEMIGFLRRALAWSIGLLLVAAGAVFAFSVFLALLLVAAFGVMGALLGGRRPAPLVFWSRWREMRARNPFAAAAAARESFARSGAPRAHAERAEVVDVEARELR